MNLASKQNATCHDVKLHKAEWASRNWTLQLQCLFYSENKTKQASSLHYESAPLGGKIEFSKQVSTWESKSEATWTGLAWLSAMTKTSEGPAGMSIEIMASLFCREKLKRESTKREIRMTIYSLLFHYYKIYTNGIHENEI